MPSIFFNNDDDSTETEFEQLYRLHHPSGLDDHSCPPTSPSPTTASSVQTLSLSPPSSGYDDDEDDCSYEQVRQKGEVAEKYIGSHKELGLESNYLHERGQNFSVQDRKQHYAQLQDKHSVENWKCHDSSAVLGKSEIGESGHQFEKENSSGCQLQKDLGFTSQRRKHHHSSNQNHYHKEQSFRDEYGQNRVSSNTYQKEHATEVMLQRPRSSLRHFRKKQSLRNRNNRSSSEEYQHDDLRKYYESKHTLNGHCGKDSYSNDHNKKNLRSGEHNQSDLACSFQYQQARNSSIHCCCPEGRTSDQYLGNYSSKGKHLHTSISSDRYHKDSNSSFQIQDDDYKYFSPHLDYGHGSSAQHLKDLYSNEKQKKNHAVDSLQKKNDIGDQSNPDLHDRKTSDYNLQLQLEDLKAILQHQMRSTKAVETEEAVSPATPELILAMHNMIALFTPKHELSRTPLAGAPEKEKPVLPEFPKLLRRRKSPVKFEFPQNRKSSLSPLLVWREQDRLLQTQVQELEAAALREHESNTVHLINQSSQPPAQSTIPKLPKLDNMERKCQQMLEEFPIRGPARNHPRVRPPMTRLEKSESKHHSLLHLPPVQKSRLTRQQEKRGKTEQTVEAAVLRSRAMRTPENPPANLPFCLLNEPMRFRPVFIKPQKPCLPSARQFQRPPQPSPGPSKKPGKKDLPDHLLFGNFNMPRRGLQAEVVRVPMKTTRAVKPKIKWK